MNNNYLVGFLDILGTTEKVKQDTFDDMLIFDFVNPVGLIARLIQSVRFAVFSDCVILSTKKEFHEDFVSAISFIFTQWFSDFILVRGGISLGEINWVDDPSSDKLFRGLPNFSYARVYGKALTTAYRIEHTSGPGAICFADESAAEFLKKADAKYIFQYDQTETLTWNDKIGADYFKKTTKLWLENTNRNSGSYKHLYTTYDYFLKLYLSGNTLPSDFGYISKMRNER